MTLTAMKNIFVASFPPTAIILLIILSSCSDKKANAEERVCAIMCDAMETCWKEDFTDEFGSMNNCVSECVEDAEESKETECFEESQQYTLCIYEALKNNDCDEIIALDSCWTEAAEMDDCFANISGTCSPGCNEEWLGDGLCDPPCNTEECGFDDGDCEGDCSPGCPWEWVGNGSCEEECNNFMCFWDWEDCG